MMLVIAVAGLAVNILAFWVLHGAEGDNLNVRAAALHVLGDLLGSVGAIIAALTIMATGWTPIDPILSVAVAMIILRSAWHVVRESGHILLEGSPRALDTREIADDLMQAFPMVEDVHHVHAWSITEERPMVTLHARMKEGAPPEQITAQIKQRLADRFGIPHVTVEIEFDRCSDEPTTAPGR
jgi:cobalt-zinc-cadmium efflux system protein